MITFSKILFNDFKQSESIIGNDYDRSIKSSGPGYLDSNPTSTTTSHVTLVKSSGVIFLICKWG